jgi:hypothetical protein
MSGTAAGGAHDLADHAQQQQQHVAAISSQLQAFTDSAQQGTHKLCHYVLENVLLHQAAAQQLQVCVSCVCTDEPRRGCVRRCRRFKPPTRLLVMQGTAANLVNSGQQLLATSRQMAPQLQQLTAMAAAAQQLRAQAEGLRQLSTAVLQQQQQQQQQQGKEQQAAVADGARQQQPRRDVLPPLQEQQVAGEHSHGDPQR